MGFLDFLGGGSTPTVDFTPLIEERKKSAQKQTGLIQGAYGKLPEFTAPFVSQRQESIADTQARRQALANAFKAQLGEGLKAQGTEAYQQAQQQILSSVPELQRMARESAAATGGLQRGAALRQIEAPITEAQTQLGDVAGQIALQTREAQNQALQNIFQGDQAFELQRLGIDLDTAQQLLDMGRGDVLNEALQLAGIEAGTATDILNLGQSQLESNLASQLAQQQRRASILGALIGAGGLAAGSYLGR